MRNFNGLPMLVGTGGGALTVTKQGVAKNTTAAFTKAAAAPRLDDFVLFENNASMAGTGTCGGRVSVANTVEATVLNATGVAAPGAAATLDFMCFPRNFRQFNGVTLARSAPATPLNVAQNAATASLSVVVTVACPGAKVGDYVIVRPTAALEAGYGPMGGYVAAPNVVSVIFANATAGNLPAAAAGQNFDVICIPNELRRFNGIPVVKNPVATPVNLAQNGVLANATALISVAVPGCRVGDFVLCKPRTAIDAGLGIGIGRVAVAGTAITSIINMTAGALPAGVGGLNFDMMCLPSDH